MPLKSTFGQAVAERPRAPVNPDLFEPLTLPRMVWLFPWKPGTD